MPEIVADEPPELSDEAIEAWAAVLIDLCEKRQQPADEEPKADQRQAA